MSDQIKYNPDFYVVGGTMKPDAPSYVERKADQELYERILKGEFCCVLTPRQMGKSSLMARTADRLKKEGVRAAIIDLTRIGTEKGKESADKWFNGIAYRIVRELGLKTKLSIWWQERERLPALQRLTEFFEDVLLPGTNEPVVIFVDEIDTTIALPFTDDFFAAIRACYNARAVKIEYQRLNFVLLGVANPSDLIKDTQRTPFNIGHGIHLTDFTLAEAKPLSLGLCADPAQGEKILERILYWTGGHPYLTQKLCRIVAGEKLAMYSDEVIDNLVEKNFLSPGTNRQEPNLRFVGDRMLQDRKNSRKRLKLYRRIYHEKPVLDDPLSPTHSSLKLSGLVVPQTTNRLSIRNRIYERTFTGEWIKEVIPTDWNRNIAVATIIFLLICFPLFYAQFLVWTIRSAQEDVPIDAYKKLKGIPFYKTAAENLFADYWHRRALRSVSEGIRDEGLLYYLKALKVKELKDYRSEARQLIRDDFKNLIFKKFGVRVTALSHDGKIVFTGGLNGRGKLWKVDTGELLLTIQMHKSEITSVAFNTDGTIILTGSNDLTSRLWQVKTGKPISQPMEHGGRVEEVAFSPDGKKILTRSDDGIALWWQVNRGKYIGNPIKIGNRIRKVAFCPDGKKILIVNYAGTARLWEVDLGKCIGNPMEFGNGVRVRVVAFSPDGKKLITGGDRTARIWQTDTYKPIAPPIKHDTDVFAAFFSSDSKMAFTCDFYGSVRLWQADTGKFMGRPIKNHGNILDAAISADGKKMIILYDDYSAILWEVNRDQSINDFINHGNSVLATSLSPYGKLLVTGGKDGIARLWQTDTGKPIGNPMKHRSAVETAVFSPDGKKVLTGSADGMAQLWKVDTTKPISTPIEHGATINFVSFSPNGKVIVTVSVDGIVKLWNAYTGNLLNNLMKTHYTFNVVDFSPDEKILAAGGGYGRFCLWNVDTGEEIGWGFIGGAYYPSPTIRAMDFSPNGKWLLIGGDLNWVELFSADKGYITNGIAIRTWDSGRGNVCANYFSPDGKVITFVKDLQIYQYFISKSKFKPKANRLLPGEWTGAYRFLDDKGDQMQVAVRVTGDSIKIINLRFDKPDAPPIQGDPEELLKEWQKKLALKLNEKTGKIETMYQLEPPSVGGARPEKSKKSGKRIKNQDGD